MVKLAERSAAYIWNPNGDIDFINPSAIMADISAGDLKNAETGVAGKFHPPPPLGSMRGGGGWVVPIPQLPSPPTTPLNKNGVDVVITIS